MCEVGQTLNKLAREQMKLRLLQDIRADIEICKLEGMDYKEYLLELKDIVDGFLRECDYIANYRGILGN